MQARRRAQPSGTNSPSSSHPRWKAPSAMRDLLPCPPCGRQGRPDAGTWQARILEPRGERLPRARPQRRGSPGPIPNPAVKPAFAESTAARGCGRAGRRARGGRFSICARPGRRARRMRREGPAGGCPPAGLSAFPGPGRGSPRSTPWVADLAGDRAGVQQARLGLRGDSSRVFYLGLRLAFALLVVMASSHLRYCCVLPLDFVGVFLFLGCWPSFWWV